MKQNESGLYGVVEGEIFITDEETGEKMIFVLDKENEVVIRSLLENDIKSVAKIVKGSSSEKRNYMRSLWDFIPQKGSENYAFVVEKIVGNNSDNCYEKDREIIGVGFRETGGIIMHMMNDNGKGPAILELVNKLAKFYKIPGQPFWRPATVK